MKTYSTRQAAQKLGLHPTTLADYVAEGKVPSPQVLKVGTASLHAWTDAEIENVRQLLPKIANGRKTRYKKHTASTARRDKLSNQQSRQARDRSVKAKDKTKTRSKKKK